MGVLRFLPLVLLACTGCPRHATTADTAVADAAKPLAEPAPLGDAAPPSPVPLPTGPHRRGLVGMVFRASHDVGGLTAEQGRAVDRIEEQLQGGEEGVKKGLRGYEDDLVAGIRAGKLDGARMEKRYAEIDAATYARQREEATALNELHAAIGSQASQAVVVAVLARRAAHALRPPDDPPGAAGDWARERLERITLDCGLDANQEAEVKRLLARSDLPTAAALEARKDLASHRADALLRAFGQGGFDAGAGDLWLGVGDSPHELLEREGAFLGQLLPLLKPDQREKLALGRTRPAKDDRGGSGSAH